jgi:hypothetical protein
MSGTEGGATTPPLPVDSPLVSGDAGVCLSNNVNNTDFGVGVKGFRKLYVHPVKRVGEWQLPVVLSAGLCASPIQYAHSVSSGGAAVKA